MITFNSNELKFNNDGVMTPLPYFSNTSVATMEAEIATKANKTAITNPNLLDNPWFTINQRGATSYTVGAYGVDRWKLISGSATVSNNQITLNGTLRQIREFALGTNSFTCSVKCASGTATVSYDDSTKYFDIVSSGGVIEAVKLELGSISTLAMDTAPNYAEELLKCQRYFIYYNIIRYQRSGEGQYCGGSLTLPTEMRVIPTLSYDSLTSNPSGITITAGGLGSAKNMINLDAFLSGTFSWICFNHVSLSADL